MRAVLGFAIVAFFAHYVLLLWIRLAAPKVSAWRKTSWGVMALISVVPAALRYATAFSHSALHYAICEVLSVELAIALAGAPLMAVLLYARKRQTGRARAAAARIAPQRATTPVAAQARSTADDTAIAEALADDASVLRRDAVALGAGLAVYGGIGFLSIYGNRRSRFDIQVEEVVVRIPKLSRLLDGYTIVQVSDIHSGPFVQEQELRRGFAEIARLRPDLLVATGDLVDIDAGQTPLFARLFADLRARDGHYCILGNHDHYAGAAAVAAHLRRSDVRLLLNETQIIRPGDGGGIALVGVDDLHGLREPGGGPDFWGSLRGVAPELPRIVLAHQPKYIEWIKGHAALQLSGHTHGGQVNMGVRPVDYLMRYVAGRYDVEGTALWVNRGFGVAGVPVRLNTPPEITKIVLVAA
jgi:uncharacterized protein